MRLRSYPPTGDEARGEAPARRRSEHAAGARYTLDAAGLRIEGESFLVELNWAKLIVVRETNEFFLFVTRKSAFYLPKRAIQWPEQLEGVRDLLVEYLGERADVR